MSLAKRFIGTLAIVILTPLIAGCTATGAYGPGWQRGWDSGELQKQIGDSNSNKRKLVMRVYYAYKQNSNNWYEWVVNYELKAENHNAAGSGWHEVKELASFSLDMVYTDAVGPHTISKAVNLEGTANVPESSRTLFPGPGYHQTTPQLPTFQSIKAVGNRFGGPAGISIVWQ